MSPSACSNRIDCIFKEIHIQKEAATALNNGGSDTTTAPSTTNGDAPAATEDKATAGTTT